jgi:hypothetical protein
MSRPPSHQDRIITYILAKDGNRPHLLSTVFEPDATLAMRVNTDAIAFPDQVRGRAAIADTLVSQFNKRYENIYTFCIGEPPAAGRRFACYWLVCMTEKDTGLARAGYGRYDWVFSANDGGRVAQLAIEIESMSVLPAETGAPMLDWVSALPYPWCPAVCLRQGADAVPALAPMLAVLERSRF